MELTVQTLPLATLVLDPRNPRTHDDRNVQAIRSSLLEHGQVEPLVVQRDTMMVVGGNGRIEAMTALGWEQASCVVLDIDDTQARRLSIALNRTAELAGWDDDTLARHLQALVDLDDWNADDLGFTDAEVDDLLASLDDGDGGDGSGGTGLPGPDGGRTGRPGGLVEDFGAPPFSVLDTRRGYWQDRRRWWWDTGLNASDGRENLGATANASEGRYEYMSGRGGASGGSAFDPVLAELMFRWFCPDGGRVLDPFGGESVKGVVAAACGYRYTAVELRQGQVDANVSQWASVSEAMGWTDRPTPTWVCGDSADLDALVPEGLYDFSFTSPPYYDLEVYSDDDGDGSAMPTYVEFMEWYRGIFAQVVARLRDGAFLVVKVGDVRDRATGAYRCFVADNIKMFTALGLSFYNDAVLVQPAGTAPIRASTFPARRKLVRTHQNVLVFWKGDPSRVQETLGELPRGRVSLEADAGEAEAVSQPLHGAEAGKVDVPVVIDRAAVGLDHQIVNGVDHPIVREVLALVNGTSGEHPWTAWGVQSPGVAALLRQRYEHLELDLEVEDGDTPFFGEVVDDGTAWVAYSAGKDSLANAIMLRDQGIEPTLYHVHGLNRSYPREMRWAERAAAAAGMRLVVDQMKVGGKSCYLEAPFKNQLLAGMVVARMLHDGGAVYALGNHVGERLVNPTPTENTHWSDAEVVVAGYDDHLRRMVHGLRPHRTTLRGDTHALAIVSQAGLLEYIHGCLIPSRYYGRVRASVQRKAGDGAPPLLPGRCGTCLKCTREEIILQEMRLRPRNDKLVKHSVKRLREIAEDVRVGHGAVDPMEYVLDHDELQQWAGTDWPAQKPGPEDL